MIIHRRRLDAGALAFALFEPLDLVAMRFRPAHIHAHEHAGPVLALGAAGAGVDFEIAVVGVGLAGKQRFELAPRHLGLQALERGFRLGDGLVVIFGFAQLDQVSWSASSCSMRPSALSRSSSASRSRIRAGRAPGRSRDAGSSASLFSSARRRCAVSTSKMPPQQRHRLLDLFDKFLGFRAHLQFQCRRSGV